MDKGMIDEEWAIKLEFFNDQSANALKAGNFI